MTQIDELKLKNQLADLKVSYDTDAAYYGETIIAVKTEYREIIDWLLEELNVPVGDRNSLIQEAITATTKKKEDDG